MVRRMLRYEDSVNELRTEQVAVGTGSTYVVSLHDNEKGVFNPVRNRIQSGEGAFRNAGSDYAGWTLMEMIIDNYFSLFEKLGIEIKILEQTLMGHPPFDTLKSKLHLTRE